MSGDYWQPIEVGSSVRSSCLNCPPKRGILRWRDNPEPGFGVVALRRNGKCVDTVMGRGTATTVRQWRRDAAADSEAEWAIEVDGPLSGVRYTRQPSGRWYATHRSMGFA